MKLIDTNRIISAGMHNSTPLNEARIFNENNSNLQFRNRQLQAILEYKKLYSQLPKDKLKAIFEEKLAELNLSKSILKDTEDSEFHDLLNHLNAIYPYVH